MLNFSIMTLILLFISIAFSEHNSNTERPTQIGKTVSYNEVKQQIKNTYGRMSIPIWILNSNPKSKDKYTYCQGVLVLRERVMGVATCVFATAAHCFDQTQKKNAPTEFSAQIQTKDVYFSPNPRDKDGKIAGYNKVLDFGKIKVVANEKYAWKSFNPNFSHDLAFFEITGSACEKSIKSGSPPLFPILPSTEKLKIGTTLKATCREGGGLCLADITEIDANTGALKVNEKPASQQPNKKSMSIEDGDSGGGIFNDNGNTLYLAGIYSFCQYGNERECKGFTSGADLNWLRTNLAQKYGNEKLPVFSSKK